MDRGEFEDKLDVVGVSVVLIGTVGFCGGSLGGC